MKSTNRIIVISFVSLMILALGPLAHGAKESFKKPSKCAKKILRPNQPPADTLVSYKMPKIQRPTASVESYQTSTEWFPIPRRLNASRTRGADPYTISMKGYNEGTQVTLLRQIKSKDIVNPEICLTHKDLPKGKKLSNPGKWLRKQRSTLIRKSVATAEQFEKVEQFTIRVAAANQEQHDTKPEVMPTHSPLKIVAQDSFNRKYATIYTNVTGMKTSPAKRVTRVEQNRTQSGDETTGGIHVPAYDVKANTNINNMLLTPAYVQKDGRVVSKFLGRKAFPAGAKVTIVNERLEAQGAPVAESTSTFVAKKGTGNEVIDGLQNDKLRVTVSFDAVQDRAHGKSYTFHTRIPKASGNEVLKARGVTYYNVGGLPGDPTPAD